MKETTRECEASASISGWKGIPNNPTLKKGPSEQWIIKDQAAPLNGKSVSDVLADANNALCGNGLPSYVGSFGDLNQLVTALNESFDNCKVSSFATAYLSKP
jgi:hypothetical protein